MSAEIMHGDCLEVMRGMESNSVDSIVTDPPYGLLFMGRKWDHDVPSEAIWREALRVLKPGGHLLAFFGSRTYHRGVVRIEDAGFEIRDQIMYVYGSGFPKSLDVSKAIDKHGGKSVLWFGAWLRAWRETNGVTQKEVAALFPSKNGLLTGCVANWELGLNMPTAEQFTLIRDTFSLPFDTLEAAERQVTGTRTTGIGTGSGSVPIMGDGNRDVTAPATPEAKQWAGFGTALKPAHEPLVLARKPLIGTVAQNVLAHGTGAINIDGCRIGNGSDQVSGGPDGKKSAATSALGGSWIDEPHPRPSGARWPANFIHDGSDEVLALFPSVKGQHGMTQHSSHNAIYGAFTPSEQSRGGFGTKDSGSAARFFYCAKASRKDRGEGNTHATVKPTDLMRYLVRLITPPGGTVLDPFCGSGSTLKAAVLEGFNCIGIELDAEYVQIARDRIANTQPALLETA